MSKSRIPSDEDFDRAHKLARARGKNIDEVNEIVSEYINKLCPLHYFILMPQRDNEFFVCVFFKKDKDIVMCEKNGVSDKVRSFVYKELERQGKGAKKDIRIVFEFDSDESVKRDFDGDYDLRLR